MSWALKHLDPQGETQGLLPRRSKARSPSTQRLLTINLLSSGFFCCNGCCDVIFHCLVLHHLSCWPLRVWHILHVQKSLLDASILDSRSMEYQKTWPRSRMIAQESEEKSCHLILQYILNSG